MNPSPYVTAHPARILIVDDDHHSRKLLEVMFTPEGFVILTASSGEEALALVAQQPLDLILLNIVLPGMDGYQVVAKIKGNPATDEAHPRQCRLSSVGSRERGRRREIVRTTRRFDRPCRD